MYVWLAAVTGARRGELCGLQWADIDLDAGLVHIAFSYLVRAGQKTRKDTKTHQERTLAIDAVTVAVLADRKQHVQALLADAGVLLAPAAYACTSDPAGRTPWNPDWVSHKVAEVARGAGVTSASSRCATTPRASCWPAASTCATRQPAWAMAAAARPRCAIMPTRCPRSTGVLPPTWPS